MVTGILIIGYILRAIQIEAGRYLKDYIKRNRVIAYGVKIYLW